MISRKIKRTLICLLLGAVIFAGSTLTASAATCSDGSTLCGYAFNDTNRNRQFDSGEQGIANWTMYLVGYDPSVRTMVRRSSKTDSTGYFSFGSVSPGTYFLTVAEPNLCPNWLISTSLVSMVKVSSSSISVRKDVGAYRLNLFQDPDLDICVRRRL